MTGERSRISRVANRSMKNHGDLQLRGIHFLAGKLKDYALQESCTPARWAVNLLDEDPEEWQRAWDLWEEWMEAIWKELALIHAAEPLSDTEFLDQYGLWKDRKQNTGVGADLNWLCGVIQRSGNGWMH